jgi:hypothetical protein
MDRNHEAISKTEDAEEKIRTVAHKIWEDEGRPEGLAEEHWTKACSIVAASAELKSSLDAPNWLQKASTAEAAVTTLQSVEDISLSPTIDEIKKRVASRSAA